jgi:RAD51-like protein 2
MTHEEALALVRIVCGSGGAAATAAQPAPPSQLLVAAGETDGRSALDLLRSKRSRRPIFTMNEALDAMLGGGVARGEVTEFCGVPGIGKTQLAIQLACDVQIPTCFDGVDGEAVYVDSEGSFVPHRAFEIAHGLASHLSSIALQSNSSEHKEVASGVTAEAILGRIHCYRVYDYVEQMAVIKALPRFLAEHPRVRLLVVDSVAFHFRRDFDDMAMRARLLSSMAQELLGLAERFDLAVVLTNQVTTRLSGASAQVVPALGVTWAHACTNRVMLLWEDGKRVARLVKSPSQRVQSVPYLVTPQGVRGVASRKRKEPDARAAAEEEEEEEEEGEVEAAQSASRRLAPATAPGAAAAAPAAQAAQLAPLIAAAAVPSQGSQSSASSSASAAASPSHASASLMADAQQP